jgi:hypothetical protein
MSADNSFFTPGTSDINAGSSFAAGDLSFGSSGLGSTADLIGGGISAASSLLGGITTANAENAKASGYEQEASLYTTAANTSLSEVPIAEANGQIETAQTQRAIAETEGRAAAVAGFGNTGPGGSNADILAESQQQGNLALGKVALNTNLQVKSYQQQATAYQAQSAGATAAAQAAQAAASGGILGGILGAAGSIAKLALPLLL